MSSKLKNNNIEYVPEKMLIVSCPFCDSAEYKLFEKFGPKNFYSYVECERCSLVYLNPRPEYNQSFVDTAYQDYAQDKDFYKSGEISSEFDNRELEQNHFIVEQIYSKLGRKGRLLEIGCAVGMFLKAAKDEGWEDVFGIDVSNNMIKFIKEKLKIDAVVAKYEEYEFKSGEKFDVIYCSHVIEHIPFPNIWMEKIKKDIKPNGLLVINVPNQLSLDRRIKRFVNKYIVDNRKWDSWRTPDHMFEPSVKAMKYFFKKHGFQIEDYFTYSKKEHIKNGFFSNIFHKYLRMGSKLRFFARPIDNI